MMTPSLLMRIVLFVICFCSLITIVCAQATDKATKTIAITIDDLPLNGPYIPLKDLTAMTTRIIDVLRKHQAPAVGFVNESLIFVDGEADHRIALLRAWSGGDVELGNHTYSHVGFRDTPLAKYEDDFVRGDALISGIEKKAGRSVRYFRHPFLQMGPTLEAEVAFEKFIEARGYKIAPVTTSTLDWMFLAAYRKAKKNSDSATLSRVSDEYVRYAEANLEFSETMSERLFGRQIAHILLLHANELTSENLDRLLKMYESRGYRFRTLESALKDPLYVIPEKYSPTSDWLSLWAFSKGEKFAAPKAPEFIQQAYAEGQSAK